MRNKKASVEKKGADVRAALEKLRLLEQDSGPEAKEIVREGSLLGKWWPYFDPGFRASFQEKARSILARDPRNLARWNEAWELLESALGMWKDEGD